ncbi:hypothetical protein JTE90_010517 [Oedothorax gibbosus]|uniref:Uncharacterized protein n=1 Tax=Oedothorax gibbosus TaxID=931172 RepID=A0AAV6W4F5_9ARAC|nr:hypothetical protein JTE90_010517 [Oedothorax gibbosus]
MTSSLKVFGIESIRQQCGCLVPVRYFNDPTKAINCMNRRWCFKSCCPREVHHRKLQSAPPSVVRSTSAAKGSPSLSPCVKDPGPEVLYSH